MVLCCSVLFAQPSCFQCHLPITCILYFFYLGLFLLLKCVSYCVWRLHFLIRYLQKLWVYVCYNELDSCNGRVKYSSRPLSFRDGELELMVGCKMAESMIYQYFEKTWYWVYDASDHIYLWLLLHQKKYQTTLLHIFKVQPGTYLPVLR